MACCDGDLAAGHELAFWESSKAAGDRLLFTIPKTDRIKDDPAIWASLEREPWAEFVFFVDDGYCFVLVRFAVAITANGDLTFLVFDD